MLTPQDNERLVRVGIGTPTGNLMRRYWQPALLSSELPEPDCPQVRVRLLGENLLAFRDTSGKVGLVEAYCPHRRAPLFFARNEEHGIRCAYHGWKFDVTGKCVDMPSEPPGTRLRDKVTLKAYPTFEGSGVVWAYLGPPEEQPAPPDFEWMRAPATHRFISKTYEHCNYLQALEGGLDTAHSSFAHNNNIRDKNELRNRDTAPQIDVERTDYGYFYVSTRNLGDDRLYVRIYHYVMPNQQMRGAVTAIDGTRPKVPKLDGHIWVPIDDENCFVYNWVCSYDEDAPLTPEFIEHWEGFAGRGEDDHIPGTFRLKRNETNDYMVDRQLQKTRTYTGITGLNTQDFALQEGMGPIVDRSREFLGTSDKAIIQLRRLLLEATKVVEKGERPRGTDPQSYRSIRPHDNILRTGEDWREAFASELVARW